MENINSREKDEKEIVEVASGIQIDLSNENALSTLALIAYLANRSHV